MYKNIKMIIDNIHISHSASILSYIQWCAPRT